MYEDMRQLNIPVVASFLEDYIDTTLNTFPVNPFQIKAKILFNTFTTYLTDNKYTNMQYNPEKFGIEFKKFEGFSKHIKARGAYYNFEKDKPKQVLTDKYKTEFVNGAAAFDED